jgi:O-methyltransferase / aklanonic acid methyltransferase
MFADERVYKEYISQTFNRTALTYDRVGPRFFTHFGNRLVDFAGVGSASSVLDLGCGRGAILFPAAEKVGITGEVIGIDIAEKMLQQTMREIKDLGIENARIYNMDAEALQFPDSRFDFVICGFGLYEFYDLDVALSESFRVLKSGGIFAASLWGRNVDSRWDGFRSVVKSYRDQLKPVPEAKNIPPLRQPAEIETVMSKAGFTHVQTRVEEKEFYFTDVAEWWQFEWSHGNRFLWERMEPPLLERCRKDLFTIIDQLKQEAGIPILFQILLTRAEKP